MANRALRHLCISHVDLIEAAMILKGKQNHQPLEGRTLTLQSWTRADRSDEGTIKESA